MSQTTAGVINIDPVVSGKHIGASQLIEAGSQHLHEKAAYACRIYRFNDYEYRSKSAFGKVQTSLASLL